MISIKDILNDYNIKLYDDDSLIGGLSHSEETLEEFMKETDISPDESIGKLQKELKKCGIKEIEIADSKVQEIIERKLFDIEDELGIKILDYKWDYIEING